MRKQKGITLMTLVITIIVLLILSAISLSSLSGNNGLINKAGNAKENSEISEEKEKIEISAVQAIGKNKYGNLIEEELQEKLDENFNGTAKLIEGMDYFMILIEEKNRVHILDKNGNITATENLQIDKTSGDITKGGECTGKSDAPYKITCIEDLVAFSRAINNNEISETCYVILEKTLDFKSILSYGNYKQTYSYNEEKVAYVEDNNSSTTLMELCTTGQGFIPIGRDNSHRFRGTFEGQNNEIQNILVVRNKEAALFGVAYNATFRNFGITGNVTSDTSYAGGISGNGTITKYYNCYNKANITGKSYTGGLVGHCGNNESAKMIDCYNEGLINGKSYTGGLSGTFAGEITNCYNASDVIGVSYAGGIVGREMGATIITNCYNLGNIESKTDCAGGLGGATNANSIIYNSYNVGYINSKATAVIRGRPSGLAGKHSDSSGAVSKQVSNCYNIGKLSTQRDGYIIGGQSLDKCYYSSVINENKLNEIGLIDISSNTLEEFVELLNAYREEKEDEQGNTTQIWPESWKKWKAGEKGYPIFE